MHISGRQRSPVKHASVNGLDLAYREYGSGRPVILLMGFSAAMDMWPPALIDHLAQTRRVITLDNRGIGYSSLSPTPYGFEDMARDALGLLDALDIDQADLLGFSMGSDIALVMLRLAPERFERVVLYAGGPGGADEIYPVERVGFVMDNPDLSPRQKASAFFRMMFPEGWLQEHRDLRGIIPRLGEPILPEGVAAQRQAVRSRTGEAPYLGKITIPVLVITGSEDVLTPPENSGFMARTIPRSLHVEIQGAGHGLMYQYPDTFRNYAVGFLTGQLRSNAARPGV